MCLCFFSAGTHSELALACIRMVGEFMSFKVMKFHGQFFSTQVHKTEKVYANFLSLDLPRSWCSCKGSSIKLPVCC